MDPSHDLVGPYDGVSHPAVTAAAELAATLLAPTAEQVDVDGVPASHVRALGRRGLLGLSAPVDVGGGGAAPPVVREVAETLSAACGSSWFVTAQHRTPMEAAVSSENPVLRGRWAGALASGSALGAVAFAHLRRPGPPPVVAAPAGTGWRLGGTLSWVTSWGLADGVLVMAVAPGDVVVQALIPAREARRGLHVSPALPLAAMGGTRTVTVELDDVAVGPDEVAAQGPLAGWRSADALRTVNATPAVFGLLRAQVSDLLATGLGRGPDEAVELARAAAAKVVALRRSAYRLLDEVPPGDRLDERLALRAESLDLAQQLAAATVTASGGGAMSLRAPQQRRSREAMFHLVQAQTLPLRRTMLRRWRDAVAV